MDTINRCTDEAGWTGRFNVVRTIQCLNTQRDTRGARSRVYIPGSRHAQFFLVFLRQEKVLHNKQTRRRNQKNKAKKAQDRTQKRRLFVARLSESEAGPCNRVKKRQTNVSKAI